MLNPSDLRLMDLLIIRRIDFQYPVRVLVTKIDLDADMIRLRYRNEFTSTVFYSNNHTFNGKLIEDETGVEIEIINRLVGR